MNPLIITIIAALSFLAGWLLASLLSSRRLGTMQQDLRVSQQQVQHLQQQVQQYHDNYQNVEQKLTNIQQAHSEQTAQLREQNMRLDLERQHALEKQQQLQENERRLTEQFENLANRIFADSLRQTSEQNNQSLTSLLTPLREQLDGFSKQVKESFSQEARERYSLTSEIRSLQQLNSKMAEEAVNLTKALKGDNKTQGNWGEVVLSRVLEASGLREGHEYVTQVSMHSEDNRRMQPDVIVRLPEEKQVIIDAKMTLVAYERYFNADDDACREQALKEHITALRNHIRTLGTKDYQHLPEVNSLDYVLMFIPLEPAFLLAIDRQPSLMSEALEHNIMLVSPTTLLVALRTVANLWRYEHQNKNAQQIAERAQKLYGKVRLFVEDMLAVGQGLNKAQEKYDDAMKKLRSGSGNVLAQIEKFRHLGVAVTRPINPALVEQALQEDLLEDQTVDDEQLTNNTLNRTQPYVASAGTGNENVKNEIRANKSTDNNGEIRQH